MPVTGPFQKSVSDLVGRPNLGVTILGRLRDAGIDSTATLRRVGAPAAYARLCARAGRRLPVCYYLYALEGALRGLDWRLLPNRDKARLRQLAGLSPAP